MIASSPNMHRPRPNISTGYSVQYIHQDLEEGLMGFVLKTNRASALASLRMLLSWGIW
jgi:hypothetical protein